MENIFIKGVVVVLHQMDNETKQNNFDCVARRKRCKEIERDHDWMDRLIQQSLSEIIERKEDLSTAHSSFFDLYVGVNNDNDDDEDCA